MAAFGVYAKQTVIDFDKLGTRGLYLITGDTGSGKTTIFDAVSYALFGEPSGEFRSSKMIRSQYADENTNTSVELVFDYEGEKYTVNRTVKTDGKKTARLEYPDNRKPLEKITEVDNEIKRLLGIDQNQFKQIVMLAQGDFRRMLFSKTDERQKIFREIFNTSLYDKFQKKITEKAQNAKTAFDSSKSEALVRISGIKCDDEGEIEKLKQSISEKNKLANISTLDELCGLLKVQNAADLERKNLLTDEKNSVHKEFTELTEEIVRDKENNARFNELKALREKLPGLEKLSADDKAAADEIEKENRSKINDLNDQITLIKSTLGDYKKLAESEAALNELKKKIQEENSERGRLDAEIKKFSAQLDDLKSENEALKNAGTNLAELNAEKEKTERRKADISSLITAISKLEDKKQIRNDCLKEYNKAREKSEEASDTAKRLRDHFNDEQAGIIAEKLTDGKPCPVCGSVHHPNKKKRSENAPTQAQVEKAEELAKFAAESKNSASAKSGAAKGAYEEAKNSVSDSIKDLGLNCELENAKETAESEIKKLEITLANIVKELNTETKNNKRREELEKIIPEHTKKLDKMNAKFNELEKLLAANNTAAGEKSKQITEQKAKLAFENEKAAMSEIQKLRSNADAFEREINAVKERSDRSAKELENSRTKINTISGQLPQGYTYIDLDDKNTALAVLDQKEKDLAETAKNIEFRLTANEDALKKLSDGIPKLKKQEKEYSVLERLSEVANDKSGKFESFVQMEYFRDILKNANVHLKKMSSEQYEFIRKEISDDKRGDRTLDLNIKDNYNGTVRDVKSLSGGESFIASLSLALGLSETIQQRSGGIKLNTMFVDEGFGSLDDETLQQAMNALTSLTEDNRLIGIISHVDAVKRDISKKIVVTKDGAKGSRVQITV